MVQRGAAAVWLAALLAVGTAAEYLDRGQDQLYRSWRGLRYGCRCDPAGSADRGCDIRTGQCNCLPHVTGLACDICDAGYYDLRRGVGCRRCDCASPGSLPNTCHPQTGRCRCKFGVGGARCTACLPGYFSLSGSGCQECGPCDLPGHRCDPDTGRCICPPHTVGSSCQQCVRGFWGRHPVTGCKRCACSQRGSVSTDCDRRTGRCDCRYGFGGRSCNQCAFGFFSFPRCRRCDCDPAGTAGCDVTGNCPCDEQGRCRCKKNVRGARCDQCVQNSFSLSTDNPEGCTTCFCFTRSGQCSQAEFSWVPLTLPDDRAVTLTPGQTRLKVVNSLRVIPGQTGDVTLGLGTPLDTPIYWELPQEFLGDKIRSYNGHLRFRLRSSGGSRPFPSSILATYPLVQLQRNNHQNNPLVLEYYPQQQQPDPDGLHHVKFHESLWRRKGDSRLPVTRELLMVALQNTQRVLIRATDMVNAQEAEISDISWDIAEPTFGHRGSPALGIERCACPRQYNGSSCQDPSIGFYRTYTNSQHSIQVIIDLIGDVDECQCGGRAVSCDPDTGTCLNCTDNTAGHHCDRCAAGYFGSPSAAGGCRRCLCPSEEVSNGRGCTEYYGGTFRCQCQPGYYGERCERCDYGYYGDAMDPSVGCVPCGCDPTGSVNGYCDPSTGQCRCRAGLQGRDCTSCPPRHALTSHGCQACQDGCVEELFGELDSLSDMVAAVDVSGAPGAPWAHLYRISNETQRLDGRLTDYIGDRGTLRALNVSVAADRTLADRLLAQSEEQLASLPGMVEDAQDLLEQLKAINESVTKTIAEVGETMEDLLRFAGGESPSVDLAEALANVTAILEELQRRNFTAAQQRADEELAEALGLLERVELLAVNGTAPSAALARLQELRRRMRDMQQLIERRARQPVEKVQTLLAAVREGLQRLSEQNQLLSSQLQLTDSQLANTSDLILQLRRLYDQAQGHTIDLSELLDKLQLVSSNSSLQGRLSELSQITPAFRLEHVLPAEVHADRLTEQADRLASLFNATRQGANTSLAAARAYQEIVTALSEARQAAEAASRAAHTAYRQAYPTDSDPLALLGEEAKAKSDELLESSRKFSGQVKSLSDKTEASKKRLQRINETIQDARAKNADIRRQLKVFNTTGLSRSISEAAESARSARAKSAAVTGRVEAVLDGLETVLRPGLRRLEAASEQDISDATRLVAEADKTIRRAGRLATGAEQRAASAGRQADGVGLKLQQLKNNILKARQAASNIRVSLTANGTSCSRRYRAAELQPSTASSVRLSYAISEDGVRDALLLYIGAAGRQSDFLAIEMVNRRMRFLWNNGGDTGSVSHPLELGTNDEQLLSDQRWYIIEATRIGNLGRLVVRPVSLPEDADTFIAEDVSTAGFSVLDLTPDDPVYIGAPSPPIRKTLRAERFAGCLDGVSINGHPLGLWNFRSTRDCGACRVGPSDDELVTTSETGFDGAGYVELPPFSRGGRRQKDYLPAELWVRSFDADALLFLVANDKKGQFFSLELRDGHLVLRVGFSKTAVLVVKSNKKYNDGNWTRVEATQYRHEVLLKVNNDDAKNSVFNPVGGDGPANFDLDLDESRLYIGGVPPDFDRGRWQQLSFMPLLGCVKDVMAVTTQNLKGGNSTGVTNGCNGQLLKTVGFRGDGYMEIDSYRLKKNSNFGFSFKTRSIDGLLMISTFAGKAPADPADFQEYYMLGLVGGRLQLRMNGGTGELLLSSNNTFNDNTFHTVSVLKSGRRVELRVADRVVASGPLARGSSGVQTPASGGLFLGGLPANLTPPAAVPPAFQGCITDLILEDSLIVFGDPVSHERAAIGRCDSTSATLRSPAMEHMATEPGSTRCRQLKQVTLVDRALKFGDDPRSHVFQQVSKKEFQKDFNISLNFRTFYPNGLLLYNERRRGRTTFFALTLRDGAVVFNATRGSKTMELSTEGHLNDGQWKTVTLAKRGRRYTLQVEDLEPVSRRGPGRLRAGNGLYLGGLPNTTYSDNQPLGMKRLETLRTEGFKGCMRQLGLRQRVYDLTLRQKTSFKVGQCKAHVEQGTFFAGDAFATYEESFQLGDEVNLSLSFRTTSLDGVLISLAGPAARPALALELSAGEVVFSVQNGGSQPIRARMKFPSQFTVCDNRWHSVKAHYVQNQARLRVDKYPETYGVKKDTERILAGGFPLYIGGLPYSAGPGNTILLQQDNFKGCIRNIEINKRRRDWTDMAQLTNVLLNSCPVEK